jgi:hypothetical protein
VTPEEGAVELATFCYCGIFNQIRCADIIRTMTDPEPSNHIEKEQE